MLFALLSVERSPTPQTCDTGQGQVSEAIVSRTHSSIARTLVTLVCRTLIRHAAPQRLIESESECELESEAGINLGSVGWHRSRRNQPVPATPTLFIHKSHLCCAL